MTTKGAFIFYLSAIVACGQLLAVSNGKRPSHYTMAFNRSTFPADFIFGSGSAAYQSEGAAYMDGKGPSIWDTFTKDHPEKIRDRSTGNVADDFYHRYKGDIKLMKKIGLDSFRFSLSWPRLLPKGKIRGGVNPLGVKFYNDLINELLANGIIPFVTLFHWDLPQALDDEYGGFLNSKVVNDFRDYADFAFKTFGDRVKNWCTINEPYIYTYNGYNGGTFPPGRCSSYIGNCTSGNSGTEPYVVAHNLILSHATAVKVYKQKYQASQKGQIGITLVSHWFLPKSPASVADQKAADRVLDFFFGWFANPITYGDYPEVMKFYVGNRLPKFTKEQSELVKGSLDFLGVNYYTANFVADNASLNSVNRSYSTDFKATLSTFKAGVPVGTPTALDWLFIYPKGIYYLMLHVKDKYKNPPVYITENGVADMNNASLPIKDALKDATRIRYHHSHLYYVLKSIKKGANVKGYYVWAFFDDFEWATGYIVRFGMVFVDFKNNLKRYLKYSAYWFKMFLLH